METNEGAKRSNGADHRGWLVRHASVYAMLVRNAVAREMAFQVNFLLWVVVELMWFGLQLCFIQVLYLHTESIAGWSKWQVVLLIGASQFIQQVFQAFFLVNCTHLSELVRTGKLDSLLVLPVNPRFLVSLRQLDLSAFVNALTAVAVMVYAGLQLGLRPGVWELLSFGLLSLVGVLIHYSLMFLLAAVSFWTVRAQGIVFVYFNLFNVARLPDSAFRGVFKGFFTFAVPMLLVANVPVKLLGGFLESPGEVGLLLLMALVCFGLSELGWRVSLRRYTSASS